MESANGRKLIVNEESRDPNSFSRYTGTEECLEETAPLGLFWHHASSIMPESGNGVEEAITTSNFSISGPVVRPGVTSKSGGGNLIALHCLKS